MNNLISVKEVEEGGLRSIKQNTLCTVIYNRTSVNYCEGSVNLKFLHKQKWEGLFKIANRT